MPFFTSLSRRKLALAAVATATLVVLFIVIAGGTPASGTGASVGKRELDVGIPTLQKIEAFVQGYGSRVEATEAELAQMRSELETTRTELKESLAQIAKARQEESGLIRSVLDDARKATGTDPAARPGLARIRKFDVPVAPEDAKAPGRAAVHIPAGSFGEATILTGTFAPVTGEALPIHAKLDAALIGPNRSRIPIRDAFLVGRVQGDAGSSRALVQFQKLSLVRADGKVIEVAINADVADRDGTLGLAGDYVWRVEEMLAMTGIAGAASAAAESLAEGDAVGKLKELAKSFTGGDTLASVGTKGSSKGLEKIAEAFGERVKEILPAVHVPNGRRATVLFLEGVTLHDLSPDEVKNADPVRRPFAGLDFDR